MPKTCKKCKKKFPYWIIIEDINRSIRSRKHCLNCVPFRTRYKKSIEQKYPNNKKRCPKCLKEKSLSLFYKRRKGKDASPYCIACTKLQTVERKQKLKEKCIEYKGGKCEFCGYDKYFGAMDFHHTSPEKKDFEIARVKNYFLTDRIKEELDKCLLLCCRCHREKHGRINGTF